MCTVSIIPLRHPDNPGRVTGLRLVTNRDESRTRPPATAPTWYQVPGTDFRAVYPLDPEGGGTWVAASTSGLMLCLLNANPVPYPPMPDESELISRGMVIPSVLASRDARGAIDAVAGLNLDRFAPFTLLAADLAVDQRPTVQPTAASTASTGSGVARPVITTRVWQVRWDRQDLEFNQLGAAPVCVASSGLGDHIVRPRLPLFQRMVCDPDLAEPPMDSQDKFHRHSWPDRRHMSVMMSRPDARTVSITTVELLAAQAGHGSATVTMTYEPIGTVRGGRNAQRALPTMHIASVVTTASR